MYRIVICCLLLFPAGALAQANFGIKGGLNISDIVMTNYVNADVESDLRLKSGLHAGIFVTGSVKDRWGVVAELLYSDKGVNDIHLHYITLPLLLQYQLSEKVFAELGPEAGYLFSVMSDIGNASNTYSNKFDLALNGGIRFDLSKLAIGVRYCAGVFSVRQPFETIGPSGVEKVKYQNRVLQISVGYTLFALE